MISQIRQLHVRNYKSIGEVNVSLEPLTVFVGPNGSGKSNVLDALAFVQESLATTVELALKNRGGIGAVRRRSGGRPTHIGINLALDLEDGASAEYGFIIAAKPKERFRVAHERCCVKKLGEKDQVFELRNGEFRKKMPGVRAKVAFDRLGFSAACVLGEFRPVYDFLSRARFYSIIPDQLRQLQEPDPGEFLKRDGSNAAAVLKRLGEDEQGGERYACLCQTLAKIAPGLQRVEYRAVGQKETLRFRQDIELKRSCPFDALNMSDGTLRILALLLAVYQIDGASLVAIEEPGAIVYPASAEIVMRVLMETAAQR
ncbi:AAA family ATPase, partial [Candidatus Sumerlaeota bacterium]|nr:AAA family ATPase [Candidatus Sumerlaeota bacterium]